MSMNCFFGLELQPTGSPSTPIIPPGSTLVVTQVCVTSAFPTGGAVTLYVQSHQTPQKLAICTLHPDKGVYHWPTQLIFAKSASFFLQQTFSNPVKVHLDNSGSSQQGKKAKTEKTPIDDSDAAKQNITLIPNVHISGYYEADEKDEDDDDEEQDEEDDEDASEFMTKQKSSAHQKKQKQGVKGRGGGDAAERRGGRFNNARSLTGNNATRGRGGRCSGGGGGGDRGGPSF